MFAKIKSFFTANALASVFLSLTIILAPQAAPLTVQAATKEELQQQLDIIEKQIADYESQLAQTRSQKNTLANAIKELKTEQTQLNLQIKSTNIMIDQLDQQIGATTTSINQTKSQADQVKGQISETIRQLAAHDDQGLVYVLASGKGLSGFFEEVDTTQQLSKSLSTALDQLKQIQGELEQQNTQLESQQQDARDLLAIKALQQQDLSGKLDQENSLLSDTQGKEARYAASLSDANRQAAQIRNQIYPTADTIGRQVTFGEAVDMANKVSQQTGVRTAFLLAILTQETNLGKNVGTCNRPGDPPEKSWRVVMKPNRDQEPFMAITAELGLDTDTTPVSCPMRDKRGNSVGWGGAMGPAQFIPSTWLGYKDQVAAITGKSANPWDFNDAFLAAAIKLKAGGALDANNGEWKAAMRYFSGGTNTRYRFYGDNVIKLAAQYQNDINQL